MTDIRQIPLTEIDATALPRDRTALDPEALDELRHSILRAGLRQPLEVYRAQGTPPYGLISGYRRLTALRELAAQGLDRFAQAPCFLRAPDGAAPAFAAMVEENEIRAALSPFERGRIAVIAHRQGVFQTVDAAVATLYAAASPAKRSRLRALALVADELDGCLKAPEALTMAQGLRLATALRADMGPLLRDVLEAQAGGGADTEWAALLPYVEEAEGALRTAHAPRPGRPRRSITPRKGLSVRREWAPTGYLLRFSGKLATSDLVDDVMREIERMFEPV